MSAFFSCKKSVIPTKLHYCWFGGQPYPATVLRCMESWKKFAGDFEFYKWDETNCDLEENEYVSWAAREENWAFVSDYFRLKALYENGGIYLDCDMELKGQLVHFLQNDVFFEFEKNTVAAGVIGSVPGNPVIADLLASYRDYKFGNSTKTIVTRITDLLIEKYHLKKFDMECLLDGKIRIYPADVLLVDLNNGRNVAIHHYEGSWLDNKESFLREVRDYAIWKNYPLRKKVYERMKVFIQVYLHTFYKIMRDAKHQVIK